MTNTSEYNPQVFRVVSFNANHTANYTAVVLQRFYYADAIFIQEPSYSVLKRVPSPTNPLGDEFYGTQAQSTDWLLLEVRGIHRARVACYINRRWVGASPRTRHDIISHPHLLCFSLMFGDTERFFLNVYSHPDNHEGTKALIQAEHLPSFTLIAGDFNLHHTLWESNRRSEPHAQEIVDFMPDVQVSLLNTPDIFTHFPHRRSFQPSVIDLAWLNSELVDHPLTSLTIDPGSRMGSDHAVLIIDVPTAPTYVASPRIRPGSEEEAEFIVDVIEAITHHSNDSLSSPLEIETSLTALFSLIQEAFDRHARIPDISSHSKPWWNEECRAHILTIMHATGDEKEADTVLMMLRASRGGSTPHPRMPRRLLLCWGALTPAGEVFPSKLLVPSPLVLPWLPHAREGGPLQGSPSPSPPALERPTQKSRPTPASLTSLSPWTCQRPVTNESP